MPIPLNRYVVLARLQPALLVALPLALLTLAWVPGGFLDRGLLWGLIVTGGGTAFLVQLGRDRGRNKEGQLFREWGGAPTTRMLRHRESTNDKEVLRRRHGKLQGVLSNIRLPTSQDEEHDPEAADKVYEKAIAALREKTRDQQKFEVLFEENISYGFRRNLWGMRSWGIATALIGTAGAGVLIGTDFSLTASSMPWYEKLISTEVSGLPIRIICGLLNLGILLSWIVVINKAWVKSAAEAYANQLLASIEII